MRKDLEQKFDEKFVGQGYNDLGQPTRPLIKPSVVPLDIKSFIDSTIKQAAEEIRVMKLIGEEDRNEGLEAAARHLESLIFKEDEGNSNYYPRLGNGRTKSVHIG